MTVSGSRVTVEQVHRGPGDVVLQLHGVVDRRAVGYVRRELGRLLTTGPVTVLVDLSDVPQCDCRVLPVLDDARRRLEARRGRFALRGLDPEALTGFAEASLRELLAAYRASPGVGQPLRRGEPEGVEVPGRCTEAEHNLVRACAGLASSLHPNRNGAHGVGDRLTAQCVRRLGGDAALLLVEPGRVEEMAVVSASTERARSLAELDAGGRRGPMQECLRTGESFSVPDLTEWTEVWPRFVEAALGHGMYAVRALPLRRGWAGAADGPPEAGNVDTIGVLGLFSPTAGPMASADLGVAQGFADLAATALVMPTHGMFRSDLE
jgi:anti-anti-sigma regulatory factor